jgi:putative transposase
VAFVEDVFSRMIVGWSIATHLRASLATEAAEMAVWKRGASVEGLIHHSDAGSQYTSVVYSERLAEHGIAPSVGSVGDSFDNAMAESSIGLYKTELIRRRGPWRNADQVEFATLEYIDWFNTQSMMWPWVSAWRSDSWFNWRAIASRWICRPPGSTPTTLQRDRP